VRAAHSGNYGVESKDALNRRWTHVARQRFPRKRWLAWMLYRALRILSSRHNL
jgi:hypothetical protein